MGEDALSDAELVRRCCDGDVAAFGRLVERHQDYIYNSVFHLVSDEHDAEDLAQDVFVSAFDSLESFEGRAKFTTWLYGIMLNTVRSYWRRTGRRTVFSLDGSQSEEDGPNPELEDETDGPVRKTLRREEVELVREAIDGLEDDLREILVLRDLQGLSYKDLAEVLDVPIGTVKSRLYRARGELKDLLQPHYEAMP